MGITMIPDQFDQDRRQDPKRAAEARVYDALQNLDLDGYGIYEFRYRQNGRQLDFALWLDRLGRLGLQVKGGEYMLDNDGRWSLRRQDADWVQVSSPLEVTVDGCIEMHDAIEEATGFYGFVGGVLVLPDMERDERMENAAKNHEKVYIVWGLDNLQQDLERIVREAGFRRPPKPRHSENECREVNRLQFQGTQASCQETRQEQQTLGAEDGDLMRDGRLMVGSATFNIQRVDRLVVQHLRVEPGPDGNLTLPAE